MDTDSPILKLPAMNAYVLGLMKKRCEALLIGCIPSFMLV